jgi:hypothetical protein
MCIYDLFGRIFILQTEGKKITFSENDVNPFLPVNILANFLNYNFPHWVSSSFVTNHFTRSNEAKIELSKDED